MRLDVHALAMFLDFRIVLFVSAFWNVGTLASRVYSGCLAPISRFGLHFGLRGSRSRCPSTSTCAGEPEDPEEAALAQQIAMLQAEIYRPAAQCF